MKKKNKILMIVLLMVVGKNLNAQWTTVWSEDFEDTTAIHWYADNGVWQVGIPTTGPNSSFAGLRCGATNLSGNYPDNSNTRLINITPITVPHAWENPRLRFFHWFSFDLFSPDYGRVQAKTASGVWTNLTSYSYSGVSSNVWSCEEIDLSQFADSTIQLGFYLFSGPTNQSTGWYIDSLEIRTGSYTHFNPESFESGWLDWSTDRGTWEIGVPSSGPMVAHGGTKCAGTNLSGNYADNISTRFKTTWIRLPIASLTPGLSFWHWFSFNNFSGNDYGKIQIRTPSSQWTDISPANFTGTSSIWTNYYLNLISYSDSVIQLAFFTTSGATNQSTGWYIDDVNIIGLPPISYYTAINNETASSLSMIISPNPATSSFVINTTFSLQNVQVEILNLFGEKIYSTKLLSQEQTINCSQFAKGIYFVKLSDGEKQYVQKLIIQ